jgi:hypothetical protein
MRGALGGFRVGSIPQPKVGPAESGCPSRRAADMPDLSGAPGTAGGAARRGPISGRRFLCFGYGIITQTKVRRAEFGLLSRLAANVQEISGVPRTAG